MPPRILVVDDDRDTTQALQRLLAANGYLVKEENDSMRALQTARDFHPDAVILDFLMPQSHGGDVAWQLASDHDLHPTPRLIVCSAVPAAQFAIKLPPVKIEILEKPVNSETLLGVLAGLLENQGKP